jgi:hypothetical protein
MRFAFAGKSHLSSVSKYVMKQGLKCVAHGVHDLISSIHLIQQNNLLPHT